MTRLTKFICAVILILTASLCAQAQFSTGSYGNVTVTLGPGNNWVGTVGQGGLWNVTAVQPTGSNFRIVCDSGCGGASSFGDNAAFTAGTTPINITGGWYSASATNCTSGSACAPQLTIDRKMYVEDFQGTSPWLVSGTVTTTPPANASTNITQYAGGSLTGTVTAYGTAPTGNVFGVNASVTNFPATQAVSGTFWQATQPVSGTFWQTTQPVSGTLAATQSTSPWVDNITQFGGTNLSTGTGVGGAGIPRVTVSSDSFPATQPVSIASMPSTPVTGTFWQTTQPVSGAVAVTNFPATQNVQVINGVLNPVRVSATVTNLPVTQPVSGTFFPAIQPVSGTVTAAGAGADQQAHPVATDGGGNQYVIPLGLPKQPCNAVRTMNCQHF